MISQQYLPVNNVFKVETAGQPAHYSITQAITVSGPLF